MVIIQNVINITNIKKSKLFKIALLQFLDASVYNSENDIYNG